MPVRVAVPRITEPRATIRRRFCLPCTLVGQRGFEPSAQGIFSLALPLSYGTRCTDNTAVHYTAAAAKTSVQGEWPCEKTIDEDLEFPRGLVAQAENPRRDSGARGRRRYRGMSQGVPPIWLVAFVDKTPRDLNAGQMARHSCFVRSDSSGISRKGQLSKSDRTMLSTIGA